MKPQVGALMAARREHLRLSMRAAAKLGGLSPTAWSDIEADKRPPGPSTQRAVALALGWGVDWLEYAERGETPPTASEAAGDAATGERLALLERQVAELREALADLRRDALETAALLTRTRGERGRERPSLPSAAPASGREG